MYMNIDGSLPGQRDCYNLATQAVDAQRQDRQGRDWKIEI
jgi:hypothetical protein